MWKYGFIAFGISALFTAQCVSAEVGETVCSHCETSAQELVQAYAAKCGQPSQAIRAQLVNWENLLYGQLVAANMNLDTSAAEKAAEKQAVFSALVCAR